MQIINIKARTDNSSQINAIKAVFKALKIKYSISKLEDKPYNPEFVAMIKQGEKDLKDGKGIATSMEDLEKLCK